MQYTGRKIKVSVFGQSHAEAVGAVIDGLPSGFRVDREALQAFMSRRAPGQGIHTTARKETDEPEFVSGLVESVTCGAPICVLIRNRDRHSGDYREMEDIPRPSHADWPARVRYGESHDVRGGGMFSARLTAPLCAAGGIALQLLAEHGVRIGAHLLEAGGIPDDAFDPVSVGEADFRRILDNGFPVLNREAGERMLQAIEEARLAGDSLGGVVECAAAGLPAGIGGPLFEGLESRLSAALFAIPAVKGVDFGSGFDAARMRGSEHNDPYILKNGKIVTASNHAGGIAGGMTTGMPLLLRAALKPTPSIALPQRSVSLSRMEETELRIRGRHDPCVAPRAVPAAEAVTALVLLDAMMDDGGREAFR